MDCSVCPEQMVAIACNCHFQPHPMNVVHNRYVFRWQWQLIRVPSSDAKRYFRLFKFVFHGGPTHRAFCVTHFLKELAKAVQFSYQLTGCISGKMEMLEQTPDERTGHVWTLCKWLNMCKCVDKCDKLKVADFFPIPFCFGFGRLPFALLLLLCSYGRCSFFARARSINRQSSSFHLLATFDSTWCWRGIPPTWYMIQSSPWSNFSRYPELSRRCLTFSLFCSPECIQFVVLLCT